MVEYTSPVTFLWSIDNKRKDNFKAYCFAYVRHVETNEILYAGVKFMGSEEKFGKIRKNLRHTAVMRLLRRPIYAIYVLKDGEKVNDVLPNFFVKSAMKAYSGVGIYAKSVDLRFNYNRETDSYGIGSDGKKNSIMMKYGYFYDNGEMKLIDEGKNYIFGKSYDGIFKLRRRAMFYGEKKDRRRLEDYMELDDEYLKQFGIRRGYEEEERKSLLSNYHKAGEVKYYKANLNRNIRMHVAFMRIDEWEDYVSRVYGNEVSVNTGDNRDNLYCVAYSFEDMRKTNRRNGEINGRELNKKIVVDRLIEKPIIILNRYFDEMSMKERRIWFFDNFSFIRNDNIGRWDNFEIELEGEDEILQHTNYSDVIRLYRIEKSEKESIMSKIFGSFLNWLIVR